MRAGAGAGAGREHAGHTALVLELPRSEPRARGAGPSQAPRAGRHPSGPGACLRGRRRHRRGRRAADERGVGGRDQGRDPPRPPRAHPPPGHPLPWLASARSDPRCVLSGRGLPAAATGEAAGRASACVPRSAQPVRLARHRDGRHPVTRKFVFVPCRTATPQFSVPSYPGATSNRKCCTGFTGQGARRGQQDWSREKGQKGIGRGG
eukprot:2721019-Rhodomonas_salina.2